MTTVEPPALSPSTSIENSDGTSKPPPQTPRRPGRSGSGERTAGAIMSRHVVTVLKTSTLWTAWGLLHGADYRHLVVVDENRRPVGVLDTEIVALHWPSGPLAPHRRLARELTAGNVVRTVRPSGPIAAVAKAMLSTCPTVISPSSRPDPSTIGAGDQHERKDAR
jgi:CBS-domain-containing membrane protein